MGHNLDAAFFVRNIEWYKNVWLIAEHYTGNQQEWQKYDIYDTYRYNDARTSFWRIDTPNVWQYTFLCIFQREEWVAQPKTE